jgi:hypothetical protein
MYNTYGFNLIRNACRANGWELEDIDLDVDRDIVELHMIINGKKAVREIDRGVFNYLNEVSAESIIKQTKNAFEYADNIEASMKRVGALLHIDYFTVEYRYDTRTFIFYAKKDNMGYRLVLSWEIVYQYEGHIDFILKEIVHD